MMDHKHLHIEPIPMIDIDPELMERQHAFWKEMKERSDRDLAGCAIPKEVFDRMLQESPNRMAAEAELELFRRKLIGWRR